MVDRIPYSGLSCKVNNNFWLVISEYFINKTFVSNAALDEDVLNV